MDSYYIYASGKPLRRINVESVLDSFADHVLADGDVEKALQRTFRFGTEDDIGLLDILDRLREEIRDIGGESSGPDQHSLELESGSPDRQVEDATAMREALRQIESLDDLQDLDPELMNRTLTANELEWIDKWSDMTGQMIESGLVAMSGSKLVLTAKAIQSIGAKLLQHLYLPPVNRGRGDHQLRRPGSHGVSGEETSEWDWGKPLDLDIAKSLGNSVRRGEVHGQLKLLVEDFEVYEREAGAAIHTVMLTDMSRSMFDSSAWDATKRAAIALNSLVTTTRQLDHLDLVGFSGDARQLEVDTLPAITWDQFSHGTNLHAGLQEAERIMRHRHARNRQVVIITDGEPTAYMEGRTPIFEHPVTQRAIDATLHQARRMSRAGIQFTMVCIDQTGTAPEFARMFSRTTGGRLILVPTDQLGTFIVQDVASGSLRRVR